MRKWYRAGCLQHWHAGVMLGQVERLPGITPSMAKRIVEGRPYASPRDLVERSILTERELERILDHVTVETWH